MQIIEPGSVKTTELIPRENPAGYEVWQLTSTPFLHSHVWRGQCGGSRYMLYSRREDVAGPFSLWRADLTELENVCLGGPYDTAAVSADGQTLYALRRSGDVCTLYKTDVAAVSAKPYSFKINRGYDMHEPLSAGTDGSVTFRASVMGRECALRFDLGTLEAKELPLEKTEGGAHLFEDACGRFLDLSAAGELLAGSAKSPPRVIARTGHAAGAEPYLTPYAWLTPDGRHAVYNSNIYGLPQIFAVRLPEGFFGD